MMFAEEPLTCSCTTHVLLKCKRISGFNTAETLIDAYLTPIEWTPDNDLVTTTQKLKRKNLATEFDSALQDMYAKF